MCRCEQAHLQARVGLRGGRCHKLCSPSRRELFNRLISEAEKSQLWVRSSHTHTHTRHVPMHSAHSPKSLCLTLCSAALQGGKVPVACGSVSSHPCASVPWAAGPRDPYGEHSFVQAVRPQCPQSVVRPPRLCPVSQMRELWLVRGTGQEPHFQVLGLLVRGSNPFCPGLGSTEVLPSSG